MQYRNHFTLKLCSSGMWRRADWHINAYVSEEVASRLSFTNWTKHSHVYSFLSFCLPSCVCNHSFILFSLLYFFCLHLYTFFNVLIYLALLHSDLYVCSLLLFPSLTFSFCTYFGNWLCWFRIFAFYVRIGKCYVFHSLTWYDIDPSTWVRLPVG